MTGLHCDATRPATEPCHGWGFDSDWHGCKKEPGHARGPANQNTAHECLCGHAWSPGRPGRNRSS